MAIDQLAFNKLVRAVYGDAATVTCTYWELGIGIMASLMLLLGSIGAISFLAYPLVMGVIATLIYCLAARRWYLYWHRSQQEDYFLFYANLPIALGITMLYGYSLFVMVRILLGKAGVLPTELYFTTSTCIITLTFIFDFFKAYICAYSLRTIQELVELQPDTALVLRENEWRRVSIEQIHVGDSIRVGVGEQVPVDGIILSGASSMNEYMMTGRDTMAFKELGDWVIGGTTSLSGSFEMRAEKVGEYTLLAKVIASLKHTQMSKIFILTMISRYLFVFGMLFMALALGTFCIWLMVGPLPQWTYALVVTSSVLSIVSLYPPVLTIFMAMVVAIGQALRAGIVIKHVKIFDLVSRIGVVVFDKTGTVTHGEYAVQEFEIVPKVEEVFGALQWSIPHHVSALSYVKAIIRVIESVSDHAVAHAVAEYLSEYKLLPKETVDEHDIEQFAVLPGLGVRCFFHGHKVVIGSRQYMEQEGVSIALPVEGCSTLWAQAAQTVSFVAFDNHLVAYFCVADTVRQGVAVTIAQLKEKGIMTVMITGDAKATADAIAQSIGVDLVLAQITPQDKALHIRNLRANNHGVAMVGDGVQDAQALAAADVGIALCAGIDSAPSVVDIVLLRDDFRLILKIITLAQSVMHTIYSIGIIAFVYNGIAISIAMGIWYLLSGNILSPLYAAGLMIVFSLLLMWYVGRMRYIQR